MSKIIFYLQNNAIPPVVLLLSVWSVFVSASNLLLIMCECVSAGVEEQPQISTYIQTCRELNHKEKLTGFKFTWNIYENFMFPIRVCL